MMKKIAFLGLILLLACPVWGQVTWGVRAGGSYSSLVQKVGNEHEAGSRMGFSVAGVADIPLRFIYKRLSVRTELALVNQGGSWYSGQDIDGMAFYNRCWYNSIHVPVNLAWTFPFYDIRISLYAGPSFDLALFGHMTSRKESQNLLFGHTDEKDLKPFDLGINAGFSVAYRSYFLSVNVNGGALDRRAVLREGESPVYQNNITFSVGYYFRSTP
ncbi:PorT family protein [Parabacteroides sp. OttesenSCG-928-O15]|nr:PorT family protein [Parabacteroides sp. OttesenSCG-928-O15]